MGEVVNEAELIEVFKARPDLSYITDVQLADAAKVKEGLGDRFDKQVLSTPKKMGAQTSEANDNAGGAAARQIVAFFKSGDVTCQAATAAPAISTSGGGDTYEAESEFGGGVSTFAPTVEYGIAGTVVQSVVEPQTIIEEEVQYEY